MQLRPRTGVEDVNSNKAESCVSYMSVSPLELTLHESHVATNERELNFLSGFTILSQNRAANVSNC